MSIYNFNFPNQIDLRCRDGIMDKLKVWDPAKQEYVTVVPGGGDDGGGVVPFYVKPEKIDFATKGSELTSSLDKTNLLFTDGPETEVVNMGTLRDQRQRLDQANEKIENLKLAHEARLAAIEPKTDLLRKTVSSFAMKDPLSDTKLTMYNGAAKVLSHAGDGIPGMGASLFPNGTLLLNDGTNGDRLTCNDLIKLHELFKHVVLTDTKTVLTKPVSFAAIQANTSLVNHKMIVMNTDDKVINYTDIPKSAAAPLTFSSGPSSAVHDTEKFEAKFVEGKVARSVSLRNDSIVFASSNDGVGSEMVVNAALFQEILSKLSTPTLQLMGDLSLSEASPSLIRFDTNSGIAVNGGATPYHLSMNRGNVKVIKALDVAKNTWYGFSVNNIATRANDSAYTLTGCGVNSSVDTMTDPGFHVVTSAVRRSQGGVDTKLICFKIVTPKNLTDYTKGSYNLTLQWIADDTTKL